MSHDEMLGEILRDAIARASHDRSDLTKAAEEAATAFRAGIAAFENKATQPNSVGGYAGERIGGVAATPLNSVNRNCGVNLSIGHDNLSLSQIRAALNSPNLKPGAYADWLAAELEWRTSPICGVRGASPSETGVRVTSAMYRPTETRG